MFSTMKLRQRILLGYLAPLLLLLIVMGIVFVNLQEAERQSAQVEKLQLVTIDSHDLQIQMTRMQNAARAYLLARNPVTIENYQSAEKEEHAVEESIKPRLTEPQAD